jgi:hypothetical protein
VRKPEHRRQLAFFVSPGTGESFPPFFIGFCESSDVISIVLEPDAPDGEPVTPVCIRRSHSGSALASAVASRGATSATRAGAATSTLRISGAGQTQNQRRNQQPLFGTRMTVSIIGEGKNTQLPNLRLFSQSPCRNSHR